MFLVLVIRNRSEGLVIFSGGLRIRMGPSKIGRSRNKNKAYIQILCVRTRRLSCQEYTWFPLLRREEVVACKYEVFACCSGIILMQMLALKSCQISFLQEDLALVSRKHPPYRDDRFSSEGKARRYAILPTRHRGRQLET